MPDTARLFDRVAKRYDALNTFFSLGMDKHWRKRLADEIGSAKSILDVATGTGEVAFETVKRLGDCMVTGVDPSSEMLEHARKKLQMLGESGTINLAQCAAENLPFRDGTFDAVTIAFGIRNTNDPEKSLSEMNRVLKPGGIAAILEFAIPQNKLFAPLYMFYFNRIMPLVGSVFGTGTEYKYLSDSTSAFPQREKFVRMMEEAGFNAIKSVELMTGICIIYVGVAE